MAEHQTQEYSIKSVDSVPKFDGTNHREWRYELTLRMQHLEIEGVVNGTVPCPDEVSQRFSLTTCDISRYHAGSLGFCFILSTLYVNTSHASDDAEKKKIISHMHRLLIFLISLSCRFRHNVSAQSVCSRESLL